MYAYHEDFDKDGNQIPKKYDGVIAFAVLIIMIILGLIS